MKHQALFSLKNNEKVSSAAVVTGTLRVITLLIKTPMLQPAHQFSIYLYMGASWVVRWCWENFQCRGILLIWIIVGKGPTALAVIAGGSCLDYFSLLCHFSFSFPLPGTQLYIDRNTVSKVR